MLAQDFFRFSTAALYEAPSGSNYYKPNFQILIKAVVDLNIEGNSMNILNFAPHIVNVAPSSFNSWHRFSVFQASNFSTICEV